jgi:hypothetical protein
VLETHGALAKILAAAVLLCIAQNFYFARRTSLLEWQFSFQPA